MFDYLCICNVLVLVGVHANYFSTIALRAIQMEFSTAKLKI